MRILFATDGSEGSLAAARFLASLGHHRNVHVHIIAGRDSEDPGDSRHILESTQSALGDFPGHITRASFQAGSTSEIVDEILCTAGYAAAHLIVVGARGRSALARFLMGSVAEAVARHATIPVLVGRQPVPASSEIGAQSARTEVIVGIDGSKNAHDAAVFAASFPLPSNSLLRLESVVQPSDWAAYPDVLAVKDADRLITENVSTNTWHAEEVLTNLRQELESHGATVETETVYGDPTTELIGRAKIYRTGLIVVGSRGLSGVERFFLGGVSSRVLWHAPCSVLVFRQTPEQDAA